MLPITGDLEITLDENDAMLMGDFTDDSVWLGDSNEQSDGERTAEREGAHPDLSLCPLF